MTLSQFKKHATKAADALRQVRRIIDMKDGIGRRGLSQGDRDQIDRFQQLAASNVGAIDHIIDRFGNRKGKLGDKGEVDIFRESLAISDLTGAAIIHDAIAELQLLIARVEGRSKAMPGLAVEKIISESPNGRCGSTTPIGAGLRVFVVHGHEVAAREKLARYIERLGLRPLILHEQPTEGRTIIEKFTDYADVGYAVVLLTPDDVGGTSGRGQRKMKPRARQNVIFELGYFIGRLGRERVCALYEEGVEIPSDYSGVLYVRFDSEGVWQLDLAREMKAAGLSIDINNLI